MSGASPSFRARVHRTLNDPEATGFWNRIDDVVVMVTVIAATICFALQTVPSLAEWRPIFRLVQKIACGIFAVDYVLRLWCCVEDPLYARPVVGRLRYAVTPGALIDLAAVGPYGLSWVAPVTANANVLALVRMLRVLKLVRYVRALRSFAVVVRSKGPELLVAASAAVVLLFFASTAVYIVENPAQPQVFESIPAALWWGIVTMTTVGYGDMVPITAVGRMLGALVALLGVGIVALPAGLLAAGFSESLRSDRRKHLFTDEELSDLIDAAYRHGAAGDPSFREADPKEIAKAERRRKREAADEPRP